jgi:ABC transporter substrate binding protein (PQQ-dependent alcohol dehydrogenase system)
MFMSSVTPWRIATGLRQATSTNTTSTRKTWSLSGLASCVLAISLALTAPLAYADDAETTAKPATTTEKSVLTIPILSVRQDRDRLPPLSLLDWPPEDEGIGGAKLGISDNNTTGRFLGQKFTIEDLKDADTDKLIAEAVARVDAGVGFIVADLDPEPLLKLADALKGKDAVVFNAGAPDNRLRGDDCRANMRHTAASHAMLSDALTQYLTWKKWRNLFLVIGPTERDRRYAQAFKDSAKRFGLKIVEERTFEYTPGSRRADGGFEQIQQQIPSFTQGAADHDVVIVADEGDLFGDYFPYRTWEPRPVAGTAGLTAATWHPAIELWGGSQFQNRFKRMNKRNMRVMDYDFWLAVRAVGEAASRKQTDDPAVLIDYMGSPDFELAAFKGQKVTFRDWNGQLRQPILLTTGKIYVTVSPQQGFLHQFSELDTLGIDKPQTTCKAFKSEG